jgi:hypothetical protein
MTGKYRKADNKPSDMFVNALSGFGIGSDSMTCGWCEREHLCPDTEYNHYDDDECTAEESRHRYRQYCEEEHRKNPEGVVLHDDCDAISGQELNGIMFVIDCPCNGLHRYEKFIWENKDTIRNYLKVRIEQEHRWADEQLTLNILAGISK